jgi:hypothetical protein
MNLVTNHTGDNHFDCVILENNPFIQRQLIPSQDMIEFMRNGTYSLAFYPESERNSSKYDGGLSEQFSTSFTQAVTDFSREYKEEIDSKYILVDQYGKISPSFLISIMHWVNIRKECKDEFHNLLVSCMQEQVGDTPFMLTECVNIQKQDGAIILSFQDSDE